VLPPLTVLTSSSSTRQVSAAVTTVVITIVRGVVVVVAAGVAVANRHRPHCCSRLLSPSAMEILQGKHGDRPVTPHDIATLRVRACACVHLSRILVRPRVLAGNDGVACHLVAGAMRGRSQHPHHQAAVRRHHRDSAGVHQPVKVSCWVVPNPWRAVPLFSSARVVCSIDGHCGRRARYVTGDYEIRTAFPNRAYDDATQSLRDAGLTPNAALILRSV
jgi:hypothetical protein